MGALVWSAPKKNPNCKAAWQSRTRGSRALEIMRRILPYMGERRSSKIEELVGASSS